MWIIWGYTNYLTYKFDLFVMMMRSKKNIINDHTRRSIDRANKQKPQSNNMETKPFCLFIFSGYFKNTNNNNNNQTPHCPIFSLNFSTKHLRTRYDVIWIAWVRMNPIHVRGVRPAGWRGGVQQYRRLLLHIYIFITRSPKNLSVFLIFTHIIWRISSAHTQLSWVFT